MENRSWKPRYYMDFTWLEMVASLVADIVIEVVLNILCSFSVRIFYFEKKNSFLGLLFDRVLSK